MIMKGYKLNLPIFKEIFNIEQNMRKNHTLLLKAGTGSGKSTMVPPLLFGIF